MGDFVYLHEWQNKSKNRDGYKLGKRFLKMIHKPIVCSTLKDKVTVVARRYGFDIYKKINDRIFMIRKER